MFGNSVKKVEQLKSKGKADKLAALTGDRKEDVRLAAIAALGEVGGETAVNTLVTLLLSPEDSTRLAAANAMGVMKNPRMRVNVVHQLQRETNPEVKAALEKALLSIRGNAE